MSWITINIDTLKEAKVAALIEACDGEALGAGQSARAAGLIQGVVNEVRNAVATCATNRVDEDTTKIPESQRDLCVDLINARLKNALEIELTQDERDTVSERRRQLRDIASCDLVVDQPGTPVEPDVERGSSRVIHKSCNNPTGKTMRGL
jgi:hypothetical protein